MTPGDATGRDKIVTRIITVASHKGGTGKTTTAVTLAHGLAMRGYRTLIVDLDSQGNVAAFLDLPLTDDLMKLVALEIPLESVTTPTGWENMWIVSSNEQTARLKLPLSAMDFRELVLARALKDAQFDYVFLDCAPSLDILQVAAFVASDWLLIPVQVDYAAVLGCRQVLSSLARVHDAGYTQVKLLGLLPTFYERVTKESEAQLKAIVDRFGDVALDPIPKDVKLREAPAYGLTIWEHAPKSRAVVGFDIGKGQMIGGYQAALGRVIRETA